MGEKYYRKTDWAGNVYYEKEDSYSGVKLRLPILSAILATVGIFMVIGVNIFLGGNIFCIALDEGECGVWIFAIILSLIMLLVIGVGHLVTTNEYSDGIWKYTNYIIFLIDAILMWVYREELVGGGLELLVHIHASVTCLLCLIISDIIYASKQIPLYVWVLLYLILLLIITLILLTL